MATILEGPETSGQAALQARSSISSMQEIRRAIARLFLAYRQTNRLSADEEAEQLAIYFEGLQDLDADRLRQAVMDLISRSRFMPTVAEVREAAAPPVVYRPPPVHILTADEVEGILLNSPIGDRAIELGLRHALVNAALRDLGQQRTRKRLDEWAEAIGDRWFAARQRDRAETMAIVRDLADAPTPLAKSLQRLGISMLNG
jgi:hypothetical protein